MKMKLKGLHLADVAEIQEAVTDELKKVQKDEFSAAFQKLELISNKKKGTCLRFLKKSVLKLLNRTVYVHLYSVGMLCSMMKVVLY